jgi:hypothetical protein
MNVIGNAERDIYRSIIEDYKQELYRKSKCTNKEIILRDHFAGLAMQTLPKNIPDMETLARMSYVMADAMIAESNKHHKEHHETFGEEV